MPPQNRRTPQDRRPKAGSNPGDYTASGGAFTFVGKDGESYNLPPATDALELLDFGVFLDAADAGPAGQAALAAKAMAAVDIDDATRGALRGLPMVKGAEVMGAWFSATSGDGVSVPQS
jgi:hypothetical protein